MLVYHAYACLSYEIIRSEVFVYNFYQFRSGQAKNGSSSELPSISAKIFALGKYSVSAVSLYPPSNLSLL